MDAELWTATAEMVANSARQSPELSLFVSISEAAHILGVSDTTVGEMIGSGELPTRKARRRRLVPRAEARRGPQNPAKRRIIGSQLGSQRNPVPRPGHAPELAL